MDEVKGRVLAAWCLAEQFGVFGGGRKCLHKLATSFKEVEKRTVQVSKRLLQGNRGNISKPDCFFLLFQFRKQGTQIFIVEPDPILVVSIGTLAQSPIVDIAATPKRVGKNALLFLSWVEPIVVGSLLLHILHFSSYDVDCQGVDIVVLSSLCLKARILPCRVLID